MLKVPAAACALIGLYYLGLGGWQLARLSRAAYGFAADSGGADVLADLPMLRHYLAAASIALIGFGAATLWGIAAIVRSRPARRLWLALALLAVPLHLLWLPAAFLGAGDLRHLGWRVVLIWLRMATVPVIYALVWLRLGTLERRRHQIAG
jgi:hypothetical protein